MADADTSAEVAQQIERLRSVNKRLLDGERLTMRVPADFDHDMDLIVAQAMDMLNRLHARATQAEAERDAARAAAVQWQKAAVLAALPLEAMKMAQTTRLHAPEVQEQIDGGLAAVRAALGGAA